MFAQAVTVADLFHVTGALDICGAGGKYVVCLTLNTETSGNTSFLLV
jgi:hypothetical protein